MRSIRLVAGGMALIAATACLNRQVVRDSGLAPGTQWSAVITPGNGSILRGRMVFIKSQPGAFTRVAVSLSGGAPDAALPWHIHQGQCGDDGGIVGHANDYPPLMIGGNGSLVGSAQIPVVLDDNGRYYVNVHGSASEVGSSIACGTLVREGAARPVATK